MAGGFTQDPLDEDAVDGATHQAFADSEAKAHAPRGGCVSCFTRYYGFSH